MDYNPKSFENENNYIDWNIKNNEFQTVPKNWKYRFILTLHIIKSIILTLHKKTKFSNKLKKRWKKF